MRTQKALVSALLIGGFVLSACGGAAAPTAAPAAQPTTAAATQAPSGAATKAPAAGTSAPAATTASGATSAPAATTASTGASKGKIKIVSSLPRTGASAGQTQTVINAMKMRLEEAGNKAGGYDLEYTDMDDATAAAGSWDPAQETDNANKSVADKDVMVYIGTYNSGAAKLSIPILNEAKMVMISPANTYSGLTKKVGAAAGEPDKYYPNGKRNYVRVVTADDVQGAVAAQWAQSLGVKSAYILDDQQLYGKGVADVFEATAKKLGINVLGHEGIDPKAADYKALMTKIKNLNPDLLYFGGIVDNNGPQLVKDWRSVGLTSKFMGPDGMQVNSLIEGAGAANAEGVLATTAGLPEKLLNPKGQDFFKKYRAKFNSDPEIYAIYGYEAMSVALAAIDKVGNKDRAAIRDAVVATKDFDGVLGKWSFDANGDTTLTSMQGHIVKNGKWEDVGVLGQ